VYVVHAQSPPSAAPSGMVPLLLLLILLTAGLLLVAARTVRAERRSLRICPVCASAAVRLCDAEQLESGWLRMRLECGQCGIWRRSVVGVAKVDAYERAVRRDRRRISDDAARLVRRRARRDLAGFVRALRREVVGAEDFLARARRCNPSVPGSGRGGA
jgi:hypothetical protein